MTGQVDLLPLFAQNMGNIDARDKEGNTPLLTAALAGHVNLVQAFLHLHADPRAVNTVRY